MRRRILGLLKKGVGCELDRPPTRGELVSMVGRIAPLAIANLATAVESGDVRASEIVLKKVLPDLKAVDYSESGNSFSVVIAPRIYSGGRVPVDGDVGSGSVSLGDITINIGRRDASPPVVDVTPVGGVVVEEPVVSFRDRRRKGRILE